MRKFYTSILFVCLAALSMGAYVQPDPGGRDGWLIDTATGDLIMMRAGTVVGRVSSAGAFTPTTGLTTTTTLSVGTTSTFTGDATFDGGAGAITLGSSGTIVGENAESIDNATDGEWCFNGLGGSNNENLCFDLETTSNTIALETDTGVVGMDGGAVWTTMTFQNDATLGTGVANKLTWTENSEDWTQEFATNEIVHSTSTGVTRHDFEDIGLRTTVPLFPTGRTVRFCGQASNAATSVFMPPIDEVINSGAVDMSSYAFGGGGCDGAENTTEGSGDGIVIGNGGLDIEVTGMKCGISAAGTDDVYTLQLRDDGSDVTGVTCNWTLDGAAKQCEIFLDAPVTVVAGSLLAIQSEASTNDDVSSADLECVVFYHY